MGGRGNAGWEKVRGVVRGREQGAGGRGVGAGATAGGERGSGGGRVESSVLQVRVDGGDCSEEAYKDLGEQRRVVGTQRRRGGERGMDEGRRAEWGGGGERDGEGNGERGGGEGEGEGGQGGRAEREILEACEAMKGAGDEVASWDLRLGRRAAELARDVVRSLRLRMADHQKGAAGGRGPGGMWGQPCLPLITPCLPRFAIPPHRVGGGTTSASEPQSISFRYAPRSLSHPLSTGLPTRAGGRDMWAIGVSCVEEPWLALLAEELAAHRDDLREVAAHVTAVDAALSRAAYNEAQEAGTVEGNAACGGAGGASGSRTPGRGGRGRGESDVGPLLARMDSDLRQYVAELVGHAGVAGGVLSVLEEDLDEAERRGEEAENKGGEAGEKGEAQRRGAAEVLRENGQARVGPSAISREERGRDDVADVADMGGVGDVRDGAMELAGQRHGDGVGTSSVRGMAQGGMTDGGKGAAGEVEQGSSGDEGFNPRRAYSGEVHLSAEQGGGEKLAPGGHGREGRRRRGGGGDGEGEAALAALVSALWYGSEEDQEAAAEAVLEGCDTGAITATLSLAARILAGKWQPALAAALKPLSSRRPPVVQSAVATSLVCLAVSDELRTALASQGLLQVGSQQVQLCGCGKNGAAAAGAEATPLDSQAAASSPSASWRAVIRVCCSLDVSTTSPPPFRTSSSTNQLLNSLPLFLCDCNSSPTAPTHQSDLYVSGCHCQDVEDVEVQESAALLFKNMVFRDPFESTQKSSPPPFLSPTSPISPIRSLLAGRGANRCSPRGRAWSSTARSPLLLSALSIPTALHPADTASLDTSSHTTGTSSTSAEAHESAAEAAAAAAAAAARACMSGETEEYMLGIIGGLAQSPRPAVPLPTRKLIACIIPHLAHPSTPTVRIYALAALAALAKVDPEGDYNGGGSVEGAVRRVGGVEREERAEGGVVAVVELEGLVPVLQVVRDTAVGERVRLHAVSVLCAIAGLKSRDYRSLIALEGGLPPLVALLSPAFPLDLRLLSATTLRLLSLSPVVRRSILLTGALLPLVDLLREQLPNPFTNVSVAAAVAALVPRGEEEMSARGPVGLCAPVEEQLVLVGAVPLLVAVLLGAGGGGGEDMVGGGGGMGEEGAANEGEVRRALKRVGEVSRRGAEEIVACGGTRMLDMLLSR
ncbi:unnamed protein product [Closterium sp. NIES-65]|nr:unnamed protein product [Closterium sp. NIES-65]